MRMEGGWEHLRVLEVSDAISNRANFGAVKVYRCEAVGSGKIYPRIDLSSWRGAEGACQVKGVKRAPRGARGAATAATPGPWSDAWGPTERGAGGERGAEPDALKGGVLGAVHACGGRRRPRRACEGVT